MGFGHRVYKSYDPRAKIIKQTADEVFEVTGQEPAARHRARARTDRAAGRVLRHAQALPERGLLLGPDLPGDGLPGRRCSRCCSRFRARPAGSRSGRRCSSTPSRRSPGRKQIYIGAPRRDYVAARQARVADATVLRRRRCAARRFGVAVHRSTPLRRLRGDRSQRSAAPPLPRAAAAPPRHEIRQRTRLGAPAAPGRRSGRGRRVRRRWPRRRQYILAQLKAAGIDARSRLRRRRRRSGAVSMVNVIATIPGRRPERIVLASHYDTKLRPRVPLRRRQRRRLVHGGAARARPRARRHARTSSPSSCCSSTAKKP